MTNLAINQQALAQACAELGFEKCEYPPDDDGCECCNKQNLQLYFQGQDDAGRCFCAACVMAEKAANDNYAPVA
jgi:hypothetical protein